MQIHLAFETLIFLRDGAPWPDELRKQLDELAERIAQDCALSGSCDCESDERCIQLQCTEMDEAINTVPSFIEWKRAKYIYEILPNKERDAAAYDEDYEGFQQAHEPDLQFAQRGINRLRDSGSVSVSFWIASQPGSGGNFSRCLPCAYADEAAARAGLSEYGFRFVEELTAADLPRLGFPRIKSS